MPKTGRFHAFPQNVPVATGPNPSGPRLMLRRVVGDAVDAVDLSWMRKRTIAVVALAAANPIEMLVHRYSRRI